jgi:cytochrome c oxidase assembly protein subunit 15
VYVLILVGGIVRSTGSGMGCPDWPRCFGRWSPPTSVDQLPLDYKEKYASIREKKNEKFARYLRLVGLDETADQIVNDKSILVEADFSPVRSWIEYLNRLVGVAIGFFIIAVAWQSRKLRTVRPAVFWISVATLISVIVQGWFGSIVVSTNLTTWTVTVHMFLALFIVLLLIWLYEATSGDTRVAGDWGLILLTGASMIVLLLQIFFGTELRAAVDRAVQLPRAQWLTEAGIDFLRHRSFSWTVLTIHLLLFIKLRKTRGLETLSRMLIVIFLGTFLTGAGLSWLEMPALLQPVHLLFATLVFGVDAAVMLRLMPVQRTSVERA